MPLIRIMLLCSSRLALPALQQLAYLNLLGVVIVPQHCDEWAANVDFFLKQSSIPVILVNKETCEKDITAAITGYGITMGLMVTFSFRIPAAVYNVPVHGFFNVHPGPLPQYRGADPIFQQIKNQEKQAGVTIHYVDEGFDTGSVIMQEMIRLRPTDTYGMLTTNLGHLAARLILLLLKIIEMEVAIPSKPQDQSKARYYRRQGAEDVAINWEQMDAATIVALINACNPWNKGATTMLQGRIVRLLEAAVLPGNDLLENRPPGTILKLGKDNIIAETCSNCLLSISFLHLEEGFMAGGRLIDVGVMPGIAFNSIL